MQVAPPHLVAPFQPHGAPVRVDQPARPSYLRDAAGVEAELRRLADAYPDLARVVDLGDSALRERGAAPGHDVLGLVLGTRVDDPSVPRVLFTAGVHPRETANPALLLEWAQRTLELAAGGDAARGALLSGRTVVLVPVVNPDALDTVARGLDTGEVAATWRRTNYGATGGVDLNRNFDVRWGAGSTDPTSQYYRGPAASSEPETRAIEGLATQLRPAAVYDIHSPGGVVLAPAGSAQARVAAELVSRATGYPVRSSEQQWKHEVGGTIKDWGDARIGVAALTVETGAVHHQDDAQYADTRARMLPAIDALVATVDGSHAAPAGAELLARPAAAPPFVRAAQLGSATFVTHDHEPA